MLFRPGKWQKDTWSYRRVSDLPKWRRKAKKPGL
jgi:hypothetical protein